VTYVGPGDVAPGAIFYAGLRAYDHAHAIAHVNAIRVKRNGDNATQDIAVLSNGTIDAASANTFCTGASSTQCIVNFWDQIDNGLMVGAGSPTWALDVPLCSNGQPCAENGGTTSGYYYENLPTSVSLNQPATVYLNSTYQTSFASVVFFGCFNYVTGPQFSSTNSFYFETSDNGEYLASGTTQLGFSPNYFQDDRVGVVNGASSAVYQHGVSIATGDTGAQSCGGDVSPFIFNNSIWLTAAISFWEGALYPGAMSSTIVAALHANADAFWAY
jgi:hypothetical protein